jgi:hypothetical protein
VYTSTGNVTALHLINAFRPIEGDQPECQDSLKAPTPNEPGSAITDWSGRESVRVSGVLEWQRNQELAVSLLGQFEDWTSRALRTVFDRYMSYWDTGLIPYPGINVRSDPRVFLKI